MKKVLAVILLVIPIILNAQQKFPENLERYDTTLPLVYVDQLGGGYQQVFDSVGRASIPIAKRARGMMISYYDSGWKTKRFDGPDTTNTEWWDWTNWSDIGLTIESDPIWINDSSGYYTKIWADAKFASVSDIPDSTWHEITVIDNANIDTIRSENNITLVGGDSIKLCNSLGTMMNVSQQRIPGTPPNNRTFMYTQDGWLQIGTGSNSSGNTGGVLIHSGTSGSGSSGNIHILTGSATVDTGHIYIGMGSTIGSMYEADISKGSFVRRDTTDGHLFTSQTISVNDIYDYSSLIFDTAYIYGALADTAQAIRVDLNNKLETSDTSSLQQKSDTNTYDATRSWVNMQGFLTEQTAIPTDSVTGLEDSLSNKISLSKYTLDSIAERNRIDSLIKRAEGNPSSSLRIFGGGNATATGSRNYIFGGSAGASLTTASDIIAIGYLAGHDITTGAGVGQNVYIGTSAGENHTNQYSTFVGYNAGRGGTTFSGGYNTFYGSYAGSSSTTGSGNTLIGSAAGAAITTGSSNTAVGVDALKVFTGTSGSTNGLNTVIGRGACDESRTNLYTTCAFGYWACKRVNGRDNIGIGAEAIAGKDSTVANNMTYNIGIGHHSIHELFSGSHNISIGHMSSYSNKLGSYNMILGDSANYNNVDGSGNVFIGYRSGRHLTSISDRFILGGRYGASASEDTTKSLMYGYISNTTADQRLTINAQTNINGTFSINDVPVGADSVSCVFALTKSGTLAYQDLLLDTRASFTNNMGLMLCDSAKLAAICGTVGSTNGYAADSILIQIRKITSPATSQITNGAGSLVATVEIHPPVDGVRYYVQTTEEKDIKLAEGDMIFAEITGISGTTTFTDLQLQILIEFEK